MSYHEELQHPLWQKRRLEILQDANWKCQECDTASDMLTVHHSHYIKGLKPWEYPAELLLCLCAPCHLERQKLEESLKIELMKRLKSVPYQRLKRMFWEVMIEALNESKAA